MPFLTAQRVHNGLRWLPEGTIIETDDDGGILALHAGSVEETVIHYDGVLAPGFVNAHCHLELSHMKGVIPEHTGLIRFLQMVISHRNDHNDEQKRAARHDAIRELWNNGVVAIGDIGNTSDTRDIRASELLHFHTFVELLGFSETNAQKSFDYSLPVYQAFAEQPSKNKLLRQSMVPHAPYSVASSLFRLIDSYQPHSLISIHNQEIRAEDEYYLLKQGPVGELLRSLGIDDSHFMPSGKSSLQTYLEWLSPGHPVLFIHNTFTSRNDVEIAQSYLQKAYWCFCPNANLYIENALPDVPMFMAAGCTICIGTDSLSSNHGLSVLSELITLKDHFPSLDWETLLRWGTYNGACALNMEHITGSIEPGKKPGILQLLLPDGSGNGSGISRIL